MLQVPLPYELRGTYEITRIANFDFDFTFLNNFRDNMVAVGE